MYDNTNKTCQLKSEECSREKLSEVCVTGTAAANAVGDKIPIFVTGKARKPHCFKNLKFLPYRYQHKRNLAGWGTI